MCPINGKKGYTNVYTRICQIYSQCEILFYHSLCSFNVKKAFIHSVCCLNCISEMIINVSLRNLLTTDKSKILTLLINNNSLLNGNARININNNQLIMFQYHHLATPPPTLTSCSSRLSWMMWTTTCQSSPSPYSVGEGCRRLSGLAPGWQKYSLVIFYLYIDSFSLNSTHKIT